MSQGSQVKIFNQRKKNRQKKAKNFQNSLLLWRKVHQIRKILKILREELHLYRGTKPFESLHQLQI